MLLTSPETQPQLWTQWALPDNGTLKWSSGPLTLYAKRHRDDWQLGYERALEEDFTQSAQITHEMPKRVPWVRWAFNEPLERCLVRPTMPDKPLVVRPRTALMLPPGSEVTFYVSIPLCFQVVVLGLDREALLTSIPALILSSTWFGTIERGDLCYAMRSRAVRMVEDLLAYPHRAVCPVVIHNNTPEFLNLDKICLQVRYLAIYRGMFNAQERLWATPVRVERQGNTGILHYSADAPDFIESAQLLTPPQEKFVEEGEHRVFSWGHLNPFVLF